MKLSPEARQKLEGALTQKGLRSTRQREQVYAVIAENKDHPTADELYALAKKHLPTLSLATVYNCLETLVDCELVREVHSDRPPVRYEPNDGEHAHFHCGDCGKVFDIDLSEEFLNKVKGILPPGFHAESVHIRFRGHAECEDEIHCEELAEESGLIGQTLK